MHRPLSLVAAVALLLTLAGPTAAHAVFVDPPGVSEGPVVWVGGGPVPGRGDALLDSPIGKLPPSHARGLVAACQSTLANPSVVRITAPPYFTGCHHGHP
ncbi:MAG TPA: hypothetical protein VM253_07755 [Candidatus Limnocylindrales bacterium]|nr:hypothetical protein [Candidatus Limnocylindrales bacterium]